MSEQGLAAAWYRGARWLWLLRPLEGVFRGMSALRRGLYQHNFLKTYRAPLPVVVVGNITVGGTGKTPVVIALVEALQAKGIRPGVVSRGYGAAPGDFPRVVTAESDVTTSGDEPLLIARRTGVPVVIDPDRPAAVQALLQQADIDLVICDDGLQHYALARDFEIVLIDAERGLGNGFCLPAGPLREPPSRLDRVDSVLYRGSDSRQNGVHYRPACWTHLATGEQRPLAAFAGEGNITALAGIGQPGQFFTTLETLGVQCRQLAFPDHHQYSAADFRDLTGQTILMTEKDAVKCANLAGDNAWFLRIEAILPESLISAVADLAA